MNGNGLLYAILNPLFALALAPLLLGLIKKVKALIQGRPGPPLLQQYYQLRKLFHKEIVYSSDSSFIMRLSPYLGIAFMLTASLFVPMLFIPETAWFGNIILFFYLMITAKFFMVLGGLDAGSTFGGMGSSREMTVSSIIEPATITSCAALAFVLKSTSIPQMFSSLLAGSIFSYPTLILVGISLFIIIIVESARVPVDNPETHLELTMIHEAMILEQSGPKLALSELSSGVRQTVLMALFINVIFPWGLSTGTGIPALLLAGGTMMVKMGILAITVGVFESLLAKIRFFRLPDFVVLGLFLSFITIVFELLT
ncbi:MAG: hydrogenase [Dehalococcoidia bacterium]|nr:MAG: hydrogenase [Dehalococcoidia bacterium]